MRADGCEENAGHLVGGGRGTGRPLGLRYAEVQEPTYPTPDFHPTPEIETPEVAPRRQQCLSPDGASLSNSLLPFPFPTPVPHSRRASRTPPRALLACLPPPLPFRPCPLPPHLGMHHGSAGSQTVGGGASRCGHDEAITLHEEKSVAKKSGRTTL